MKSSDGKMADRTDPIEVLRRTADWCNRREALRIGYCPAPKRYFGDRVHKETQLPLATYHSLCGINDANASAL